jgi:hypothetical protein
LRKFLVKAQKHDKMDEAEKLLSISQCQTTVVYSVTVLIRQIGTLKRQIGTCVFFFDFTYKASNSKFNHVCSGKDPDHADSNPDP